MLKALAKAPAQRYATAAGFAADMKRHLKGQPVTARPAAWTYRVQKFVARNKLAVGAATAIGVVLPAASLVSVQQARETRAQAARAEEVKKFVLSIFENANTHGGGSRKTTAVELLTEASKRLDSLASMKDPAITLELMTSIGHAFLGLQEYKQAAQILEQAVQLAASRFDESHSSRLAVELVYAESLISTNQFKLAGPFLDPAEKGSARAGRRCRAGQCSAIEGKSPTV